MSDVEVEFTADQVRRLGHWLSEWLDDAAPLNERVWAIRAESMVKSPTFQDVLAQVKATARAEALEDVRGWLASEIKAGLARKGWSQADLAFAAGLSEKHLSQMLTGKVDGALSMWQHLIRSLGGAQ